MGVETDGFGKFKKLDHVYTTLPALSSRNKRLILIQLPSYVGLRKFGGLPQFDEQRRQRFMAG